MNIDFYKFSDKGGRELNEDYSSSTTTDSRFFAVLCDGLGGHNCGEIASQTAAENMLAIMANAPAVSTDIISEMLYVINDGLIKQQVNHPELRGMRTTSVGCIISGGKLYYFNVGDSRFYFFRNGRLMCMTKDHSVTQMSVELGQIKFADIRGDADRNKLLKVMGEQMNGAVGTVYEPIELQRGDAFLLCSDGFWEYVLEDEMEIDLSKSAASEEWAKYMLVRLLLRVNGNNDNFTVAAGIVK